MGSRNRILLITEWINDSTIDAEKWTAELPGGSGLTKRVPLSAGLDQRQINGFRNGGEHGHVFNAVQFHSAGDREDQAASRTG